MSLTAEERKRKNSSACPDAKKAKKNSPSCREELDAWPAAVVQVFRTRLVDTNLNSREGKPYWKEVVMSAFEMPPALANTRCYHPAGCALITVVADKIQYQRPIHRMMHQLQERQAGRPFLTKEQQSSHLCMDAVNVDGKGAFHCCNPQHMVVEDDKANKCRQRCAGWVWIHPFGGHPGGYWYPTCVHQPPCLRFTPKTTIPSEI